MTEYTDALQNRFSAYLVVAVKNKRMRYMQGRSRLRQRESAQVDLLERSYLDFDEQLHAYMSEQTAFLSENWERYEEYIELVKDTKLARALAKLKERDKKLLFARIFGELSFGQLGELLSMKPKQAEMAYYYVLRKLRRELEERQDEF